MAKSTKAPAAKTAESVQVRKPKIYTIPKGGGVLFRMKSDAVVLDKKTGMNRQIRYCPNEPSIFVDEQSSNAIRSHILFEEGILSTEPNQPNLQDFLDLHPFNKENGGGVYLEVNTESNAQEELDTEFLLHDAVSMVRSKSMSDLLPIAIYLNMDTNQKNSELKRELLLEAKSNPKNFIGLFDNPTVKVRSVVKKCVDFQILNSKPEGMYWFDSNRFIIATPSGQDTVSVMTQFCLTEKGSLVFETIKEELAKAEA
tara:strand:- start:1459 stop:2226 length:768 start_codon:yes stop_codon:yes gene_type:complete